MSTPSALLGALPADPASPAPDRPYLVMFCAGACLALVYFCLYPFRAHCGGRLTVCKSNCKNIATALEMYASDHQGRYPWRLEQLTAESYLTIIPICPSAGRQTYLDYHVFARGEKYRFSCVGDHHRRAYGYGGFPGSSENFPRYRSDVGPIDPP